MIRLSPNRIPFNLVKYLKHVGSLVDIKVSICLRDGIVCIHMGDYEFVAFEPALRYIQEVSRTVVHPSLNETTEAVS